MSSQVTQGLLPKPGIENSYWNMLQVRCTMCGIENLHLIKVVEYLGQYEEKKDAMMHITKLEQLPIQYPCCQKRLRI